MSYKQFILPRVFCAAKDGTGALSIEVRIQKSRQPRVDNLIGIYSAGVTYNATFSGGVQTSGDTVYDNTGKLWRSIQAGNKGNTPTEGVWWTAATNYDFIQSDLSQVLYLNQQILTDDGLGEIVRSASFLQGELTPDACRMNFLDYDFYSGKQGDGTVISRTDLSTTSYRTLLNFIFDDPNAFYTVFRSRYKGVGYNTNRELYYIGDIDYPKMSAQYQSDYAPGTTNALQKMKISVQAESVATRFNNLTVRDLILSMSSSDLIGPYPFVGNHVRVGFDKPDSVKTSPFYTSYYNSTTSLKGYHSRMDTRSKGAIATVGGVTNRPYQWINTIVPATSSIDDNLHLVTLYTILSKIMALGNVTYTSSNLKSLLTLWTDSLDQTTLQVLSTNIDISLVGVCYEFFFGVDPRCNLNVAEMTGVVSWSTTLTELLKILCRSLLVFVQSNYDQTNFRTENIFADLLSTGIALPSKWEADSKSAGIKPRVVSARHVEVDSMGFSDKFACPSVKGNALSIQTFGLVKKLAFLGAREGDPSIDLIINSQLTDGQQYQTFQPMNGGLQDGGHIVGSNTGSWAVSSGTIHTTTVPSTYGTLYELIDNDHEFVRTEVWRRGGIWSNHTDARGAGPYDYSVLNGDGLTESICIWNSSLGCHYGILADKKSRNSALALFPNSPQNAATSSVPTGNDIPYVIGYGGFGLDLAVTDGSDTVSSALYDFGNFDAFGNTILGQQIIIPARGVYTCLAINVGGDHHKMRLDRAIIGDGTGLEFRIGGPTINGNCLLGYFWYHENVGTKRFGPELYVDDGTGNYTVPGGSHFGIDDFFPNFFLGKSGSALDCYYGAYTLSRARYKDGTIYTASVAPDDTYGTAVKTQAQVQAAFNLGSLQLASRNFGGVLADSGNINGPNPLDTYAEHSQGIDASYIAQTIYIGERKGVTRVDLLQNANIPELTDKNYPVIKIGTSAASGASGSGIGAVGSTGSTSTGFSQTITEEYSSDQNDLSLALTQWTDIYISASAAIKLTGMAGGKAGYRITFINTGTSNITLTENDSASLAANRFLFVTVSGFMIVGPNGTVSFFYDLVNETWRELTKPA